MTMRNFINQRALTLHLVILLAGTAAHGQEQEDDEALMAELEAAASDDAETVTEQSGVDARLAADREAEDPLNDLPQGAKEVIGNEANPSISIILDFAGAFFSHDDHLRQGGHAPVTNGPMIQGAELAASAYIDPYFRIDMAFGMYHLHIEEIYLTTMSLPLNLQFRAGQFKSNIGRHNPTHLHSWNFVTHPMANEFLFGAEGLTLPGAELSFLFPLPWYVEIIGALQMGESGSFETDFLTGDPSFADFIYPLRLVQFFDLSDDWGMQLGLNAVLGPSQQVPEKNRTHAWGADLLFKWRPIGPGNTGYKYIAWNTEGWLREMQVPGDIWKDAGGYSDLIFGIAKRWNVALRGEMWKRLEGDDTGDRKTYGLDIVKGVLSASFMPSHFSRIRLQYAFEHFLDAYSYDEEGAAVSDGPPMYEENNHTVMLQLEVSAGSHGAHEY
ncbi:MAG: hypothetical protein GY854_12470 [Deltaproteobacteria bacterium]|nr:hypothetical protein [Deltaproteobacteria bacterium]